MALVDQAMSGKMENLRVCAFRRPFGGVGPEKKRRPVRANDSGDGDSGANNLQNFPVLTTARTDGAGQIIVTGTLLRGVAPVGSPLISVGEGKLLESGATGVILSSWATRVRRDDLLTVQIDGTKASAIAGLQRGPL